MCFFSSYFFYCNEGKIKVFFSKILQHWRDDADYFYVLNTTQEKNLVAENARLSKQVKRNYCYYFLEFVLLVILEIL